MTSPKVIALMTWANAQLKAGKPLSLGEAFLAGIAYERASVHPDTTCPHGYRLINLRDGTDTCEGCAP
jgi:hypothetical protein